MTTSSFASDRVGRLFVWSSLWLGGIAWLLHLLTAWALAEFGCMSALAGPGPAGISWVAWGILAATVPCLLLCGLASWAGWRCGRGPMGGGETAGFFVRFGLAANPLFALIIIAQTIPVFYHLKDCGIHIVP